MIRSLLLTLVFLPTIFIRNCAAQLSPDSSFSQDGYIIDSRQNDFFSTTSKLAELKDGSILISGFFGNKFILRKYDASGNIVTSFGTNGEATIPPLDNHLSMVCDIDVTSDNKIWLLTEYVDWGAQLSDSDKAYIVIMSFNENGTVNNSFNSSGYLIDQPIEGYYYHPKTMAIDKRENSTAIYVGSWAYEDGHNVCSAGFGQWCISKYNTNGTREMGFNNTGVLQNNGSVIYQAPTSAPLAIIYDLQVLSTGAVVAAGSMFDLDSSFFSLRLLPNGTWDNSFGINGRHIHKVDFEVPTNDMTNSQVLPDGAAVFYTSYRYGNDSTVVHIAKSDNSGHTISSFGLNGKIITGYRCQQYPILMFKSDQTFLMAYYKQYEAHEDQKIEFLRFSQNGIQDIGFGADGICKTHPRNPDNYINVSQVINGIWAKNETGLYLATQCQPQGTIFPGSGLFKFKTPELPPTSVKNITPNTHYFVYPNPVKTSGILNIESDVDIKTLKLYSVQGDLMQIKTHLFNRKKAMLEFSQDISSGTYYLFINGERVSPVVIP